MKESTKLKVSQIVEEYKKFFTTEYNTFLKSIPERNDLQKNRFSKVEGDHALYRALANYPDTLDKILIERLSDDEFKEFNTKKGQLWFIKKYKEFRVPEVI